MALWFISGCDAEPPASIDSPDAAESSEGQDTGDPSRESQSAAMPEEFVRCPDQRPDVCTQQYDPACGYFDQGDDSSAEKSDEPGESPRPKTFGNACTACADSSVIGYTPGACED